MKKKVKVILGIPEHIKVVALTPLGYPVEKKRFIENFTKVVIQGKKEKILIELFMRINGELILI